MSGLQAQALAAFHDGRLAITGWAKHAAAEHRAGLWQAVEDNHRCNCQLWDEEDLARRRSVPDAEIAANKRAIDGHNQKRNDAIERIDEQLLVLFSDVRQKPDARLSSETAGAMIDRLSILSLKVPREPDRALVAEQKPHPGVVVGPGREAMTAGHGDEPQAPSYAACRS